MFADPHHQQHPHQLSAPIFSPHPQPLPSEHGQFFLDDIQASLKRSSIFHDINPSKSVSRQTQFALPVQSHRGSQEGGQNGKIATQLRGETGEHMLRRKTPNGTLSAGYDGTPVEWGSRPHADKHFLMPASDATRYNIHPAATFANPGGQRSYNGQVMLDQAEKNHKPYWQPQSCQPRFSAKTDGSTPAQIWLQNSSRQSLQPLDSMLYQAPQAPMSFVNLGGYQQVPTILQPLWAPTFGLTVSNAQGRFGPYWPDGSFVPYRPDALRDDEFLPQSSNVALHSQMDAFNRHQQSASNSPYITPSENDLVFWNGKGFHDLRRHSGTALSPTPMGGLRSYDTSAYSQGDPNASFAQRARAMSARTQRHGSDASVWPQTPNSGRSAQMVSRTPASSSHPHFKTRVLIWAHRIYVNLIQHSRRQNQAKSSDKTQSIFPRPPRHSYSNPRENPLSQHEQAASNIRNKDAPIHHATIPSPQLHDSLSFSQWSHGKQRSSFHERHDRGLRLNPKPQSITQVNAIDVHPSPMFPSNPTTPANPILASPQHAVLEAQRALEILDSLCQDSNWQWVDGILLGGCLAYGLEQFHAALQWYERVLACDPKYITPSVACVTLLILAQQCRGHFEHSCRPPLVKAPERSRKALVPSGQASA